ncbi:DNA-packaging protein FI [Escherichia coli]|uniref:DNA-packaging protein FI n=20 Tax=Escherichia coli TaxID=562 RepID=UPI0010C3852B|nr:DNA-packaging protein FI [Escherichia coli]GDM10067.1 phage major capsid protein [Escherichia coli]
MSMYTTAQLLAANEQKFKFDPLFLRLFFRESYPFTTEKVYLSQIPGLVNMALYVSPIVSGEVIRSRGGSTSEFTPGYVKPKHEVNPQMTLRRLPDEDPQNLADPAYRRRRIILQNMRDEELAIAQVEEMQAVSAVLKGKYTMTGEAFDPVEVDMGRSAANNITQSGGTEWSKRDKSTYDPTDETGHENEVVSAQPDTVTDTADLVTVVALVTLHTDALHATRDEAVAFVLPGTAFRVSAGVAAEMTERGLARMQ